MKRQAKWITLSGFPERISFQVSAQNGNGSLKVTSYLSGSSVSIHGVPTGKTTAIQLGGQGDVPTDYVSVCLTGSRVTCPEGSLSSAKFSRDAGSSPNTLTGVNP